MTGSPSDSRRSSLVTQSGVITTPSAYNEETRTTLQRNTSQAETVMSSEVTEQEG